MKTCLQMLGTQELPGTITAAMHATPNGTPYWIPQVDVRYLPIINSIFTHWEDIVMMYNTYATQSGFSTRIGHRRTKNIMTILI
ncbi:hypothetical protein HanIR_Chr05g0228311 [Helianthus annuus]|nr:hypothetical protein HanIR_Chr05g0228311 [Helianthus annuus]